MAEQSRSRFKILGARSVTRSMFRDVDPKILGATVQNLVARTTGFLGFVHPWFRLS
jgi:hypothetical protein